MLTLNKVNKEIKKIVPDVELVKGDGYFYFVGKSVELNYSTSVMVNSLNQLTLDQWLIELTDLLQIKKV